MSTAARTSPQAVSAAISRHAHLNAKNSVYIRVSKFLNGAWVSIGTRNHQRNREYADRIVEALSKQGYCVEKMADNEEVRLVDLYITRDNQGSK